MKKYEYITNCVNSTAEDTDAMTSRARSITANTFFKHVDLKEVSEFFGYELRKTTGLTIKNDWHVRYFKSKFKGIRCYYLAHSGIEYIYQEIKQNGYNR